MILIGLGSNLPTATHGNPLENCEAALSALAAAGVTILRRSRWYESAPMPASDQPWFVNGVAAVTMKGNRVARAAVMKQQEVSCQPQVYS